MGPPGRGDVRNVLLLVTRNSKDVESAEEVEEVPSIDDNAAEEAKQIAAAVKVVRVVEQEAAAEKAEAFY